MRLNYRKIAPEGFQKMLDVQAAAAASNIDMNLIHMVYLRTSQINGCPYCVDLHWRDAIKGGVEPRKLNAVTIFRDAPFFSAQEAAALEWAEIVTHAEKDQSRVQVVYDHVSVHFSEAELANLTYAIVQMNAFNRLAIAFHVVPQA